MEGLLRERLVQAEDALRNSKQGIRVLFTPVQHQSKFFYHTVDKHMKSRLSKMSFTTHEEVMSLKNQVQFAE